MPLTSGARLGPYEIVSALGAGGMGEVYKARDTRLDRIVAIKILPELLAADPQFRERFDREARAISALEHPHICALYDVGEHDGTSFLVMQYLEGETLASRLARSTQAGQPLGLHEALKIGVEIAGALDAAHRAGIVHRDLKPGNVMLTKSGARLLDFGLAKKSPAASTTLLAGRSAAAGGGPGQPTIMPTTPANITAQGTILGTFQYMAPEQLEGTEADARSDIFAFGCVLYEMLTGKKAFAGKSQATLIGAILHAQPPPISTVQPLAPPALEHVVATCLAKDPDERWQSAADLRRALQFATRQSASSSSVSAAVAGAPRRFASRTLTAVSALWLLVTIATAAATWYIVKRTAAVPPVLTRLTVTFPAGVHLDQPPGGSPLAISDDGRRIAFVGVSNRHASLYVHRLDTEEATLLAGTEGASGPVFSPDGSEIAFAAGSQLKKVAFSGGRPTVLGPAPTNTSVAWHRDGRLIIGATGEPLREMSASGGGRRDLTHLTGDGNFHLYPAFLPDGRTIAFSRYPLRDVVKLPPGSTEPQPLMADAINARAAEGLLLFARGNELWSAPLNSEGTSLAGDARRLVDRGQTNGAGTLVYAAAGNVLIFPPAKGVTSRMPVWVDRSGHETPLALPAHTYRHPRLSPDGERLVVTTLDEEFDVWTTDLHRATFSRLTFGPSIESDPVWSPNQREIYFTSGNALIRKAADGTGPGATLLVQAGVLYPTSIVPDGRTLLVFGPGAAPVGTGGSHIATVSLEGEARLSPLVVDPGEQRNGMVSPEGRWLAYESTESGHDEIYVRPYPKVGDGKWQVSTSGGVQPLWSKDGQTLFYRTRDGQLMSVSVKTQPTFAVDTPNVILASNYGMTTSRSYDVSPDGKRFLVIKVGDDAGVTYLNVILNWQLLAGKR